MNGSYCGITHQYQTYYNQQLTNNSPMRQSLSSISNLTDRSPIDQALRKSIRQAKSKLFDANHLTSDSQSCGTFGRQQSVFSSQIESKLAVMFKENIREETGGKLITFANNFDSKYQTSNKKGDGLQQRINLLEETNMELQEFISYLKEENSRLNTEVKFLNKSLIKATPESKKNSENDNYKIRLIEAQKEIELKQKIILKKDEEINNVNTRLKQLELTLRKLQTEHSILQMSDKQNKQRLIQQTESHQQKVELLTRELYAVRRLIPLQKSSRKEKQNKQALQNDDQKYKLTKKVQLLKVENKILKTKLIDSNKQNVMLEKKEEEMENQLFKIQQQKSKALKDLKKKEISSTTRSRGNSLGTIGSQSNKNMLKTGFGFSKRSSLARIYNNH